jgi:hypothetical protein
MLQYLPGVAAHEQSGCAHLSAFGRPLLSFNFGSRVDHPNLDISHQAKVSLYGKEHIAKVAISLQTARGSQDIARDFPGRHLSDVCRGNDSDLKVFDERGAIA